MPLKLLGDPEFKASQLLCFFSPLPLLDKDFQLMLFILLSDSKNYQNQTIFIKYLRWRYIMNSNTIFVSARIKTFAQSCEGTMRYKIPNTKHTTNWAVQGRRSNTARPNSMEEEFSQTKTSRYTYLALSLGLCVGLKTHLCINFTNRQMEAAVYYIHLTW